MRLTALLLLSLLAASCGGDETSQKQPGSTASTSGNPAREETGYRRLEGTLAGKRVVFHLQRSAAEPADWSGTYSYESAGLPIDLSALTDGEGRSLSTPDSLILTEWDRTAPIDTNYGPSPTMRLRWTPDGAQGLWISADGRTRYPVSLREDYPTGSLRLRTVRLVDSGALRPAVPRSPKATITYAASVPAASGEAWLEAHLRDAMGLSGGGSWEDAFRSAANAYLEDYRASTEIDDSTDPAWVDSYMYRYSEDHTASVLMHGDGWLVLELMDASYTGGAHGNYAHSYLNADLQRQQVWRLTDVVADTGALVPFLDAAARYRFRIAPDEPLGDRLFVENNTISVTDVFFITPTGLGFVYNPYEIASYADGSVTLFLPYKRIVPFLTPSFRQRMNLTEPGAAMRG